MKNKSTSTAVLCIVVVLMVVLAVMKAEPAPKKPAKKTAATSASAETKVLEGEAQGFGGVIHATVTMEGDKIVDVVLVGDNETPELGGKAMEELPARIIEAQSAEVDAFAGASVSSAGITAAVQDALSKAN